MLGPAFLVGTEFAHFHPVPDLSPHAALPTAAAEAVIDAGWAEWHPLVDVSEADLLWLEGEASTNPRLREALAGVWVADSVSSETFARLEAAARAQLRPPRA